MTPSRKFSVNLYEAGKGFILTGATAGIDVIVKIFSGMRLPTKLELLVAIGTGLMAGFSYLVVKFFSSPAKVIQVDTSHTTVLDAATNNIITVPEKHVWRPEEDDFKPTKEAVKPVATEAPLSVHVEAETSNIIIKEPEPEKLDISSDPALSMPLSSAHEETTESLPVVAVKEVETNFSFPTES